MKENKKAHVNDDLEKLHDGDMDNVAGGYVFFGEDYEDGFERTCLVAWHGKNECPESPDGYHYWIDGGKVCQHICKRCGKHGSW